MSSPDLLLQYLHHYSFSTMYEFASMAFTSVNPYTGETLKTFPEITNNELKKSISSAYVALKAWRDTSFSHRAEVFEYYAKHAESPLRPEKLKVADPAEGETILVHQPQGPQRHSVHPDGPRTDRRRRYARNDQGRCC